MLARLALGACLTATASAQFTDTTLRRVDADALLPGRSIGNESQRTTMELVGDRLFVAWPQLVAGTSNAYERRITILDVSAPQWTVEQEIVASDLVPAGQLAVLRSDWSVDGDVLALQVQSHDPTTSASVEFTAVLEPTASGWVRADALRSSSSLPGQGAFRWAPVVDGDRIVVVSEALDTSLAAGELVTYERAAGSTGFVEVGRQVVPANGGRLQSSLAALEGDRLAVAVDVDFHDYPIQVWAWNGATWELRGEADPRSAAIFSAFPWSLALTEDTLVVGVYYDAWTVAFDLDASGVPATPQRIGSGRLNGRDFNPPYAASVAIEGDFIATGVGIHYLGAASVTALERADGAFRAYAAQRLEGVAVDVALDGGRLVTLVEPDFNGPPGPQHFLVQEVDRARHLPYCPGDADLFLSGSGDAPLDAAAFRAYGLPAGALAQVFGGFTPRTAPAGSLSLCIGGAFARIGSPRVADANGQFTQPTTTQDLTPLSSALVPGGTVTFQVVFRAAGGQLGTSNAQAVQLAR